MLLGTILSWIFVALHSKHWTSFVDSVVWLANGADINKETTTALVYINVLVLILAIVGFILKKWTVNLVVSVLFILYLILICPAYHVSDPEMNF